MIGKKEYDRELHYEARPAEIAVLRYLNSNSHIYGKSKHCGDIDPNKDGYSDKYDYEVEWRKDHWKNYQEQFPYKTVTVPIRKFYKINPRSLYFVVREDCKKCILFSASDFMEGKIIKKDTKYSESELFVELPVELGKYIIL